MHTPCTRRYEPFAVLADVRPMMRTKANARATSPTGTHRAPLEALLSRCSVARVLAFDSMSMASDVGRTLLLHSPLILLAGTRSMPLETLLLSSIRLAVACSMPLETLILLSNVGHMLPLETLLQTRAIEEATALDTLLI
jgi:hypothetical protein